MATGEASRGSLWPVLDYAQWRDTALTLQLWTQIVGKTRLSRTPWLNHSWHAVFYVTARGLSTSPIAVDSEAVEIEFDFIDHKLEIRTSTGEGRALPLTAQTVSAFYHSYLAALSDLGFATKIYPVERGRSGHSVCGRHRSCIL